MTMERVRGKIFDIVTDPPCHQGHKYCEFWDVQGHYCYLKDIHKDTKKCVLLDQILAIPKIRIEDPDQELTKLRDENKKLRRLLVRYKAWNKEESNE